MASPTTSWTGSAVVNGLMAIVLLAWLADYATQSPTPRQREKTAVSEPSVEQPDRPIAKPVSVDLPPPPP